MTGPVKSAVVSIVLLTLGLGAAPAWAHGSIEDATPEQGSRVAEPPTEVSVHLAEPPAQGSTLVVIDGCKERVGGEPQIDGEMLSVPVADGRPGRWNVKLRSISSVDGHLVREPFSFTVRGKKQCSTKGSPDGKSETDGTDGEGEVQLGDPQPPLQNEETSFPVVPFALGTVVVVALAIALRRPGKKP